MKRLLPLALSIITSLYAFTNAFGQCADQINWYDPSGIIGNDLLDVKFTNASTGYIAGEYGTLLKTKDAGNSWSTLNPGVISDLNSLYFINEDTGYVAGNAGTILRTTDAGKTWQFVNSNPAFNIYSIIFPSPSIGYAVGYGYTPVNKYYFLKSTDGGLTWATTSPNEQGNTGAVSFINDTLGFVVGWNGIYKTTDGGTSWNTVSSGSSEINSVHFLDSLNGYGLGGGNGFDGYMMTTTDGGKEWGIDEGYPYKVAYYKDSTIIYVGSGYVLKTTNGGNSWDTITTNSIPDTYFYNAVTFTDTAHGTLVGNGGIIFTTSDGGRNWKQVYNYTAYTQMQFISPASGFAIAGKNQLLSTTDSGNIWNIVHKGTVSDSVFTTVFFTDKQTGYIGGVADYSVGFVLKTTDGGSTFRSVYTGFPGQVKYLNFLNKDTGFVVTLYYPATMKGGGGETLARTTDGGNTWQQILNYSDDNTFDPGAIQFVDASTAYLLFNNGTFKKSTDCGTTWDSVTTLSITSNQLFFTDRKNGYVLADNTDNNVIAKTMDGGRTWNYDILNMSTIYYMCFTDSLNGIVIGNGGTISKTDNGGQTWESVSSITNTDLLFAVSSDSNTYYIFADNGPGTPLSYNILKLDVCYTNDIAATTQVTSPVVNTAEALIYPNPNKGSFTFVTETAQGYLKIYNPIGKEMQAFTVTTRETSINMANTPQGIYIVDWSYNTERIIQKVIVE